MRKNKWKATAILTLCLCFLCLMSGCSKKEDPVNDFDGYPEFLDGAGTEAASGTSVETTAASAPSVPVSEPIGPEEMEGLAETEESGAAETVYEEPVAGGDSRTQTFKRVSDQVTVTTDLNVRDQPSSQGKVLGVARVDDTLERTGIGSEGWDRVKFDGKTGYVNASLLDGSENGSGTAKADKETTKADKETTKAADKETTKPPEVDTSKFEKRNETVYTTGDVYVRKGPGTAYEALGILASGNAVTRTGKGGQGWDQISYNGQTGYAYNKYLSTDKPANYKESASQSQETTSQSQGTTSQSQESTAATQPTGNAGASANGQTVYAICPVCVNPENSASPNPIGVLETGEAVKQISIGKDGWTLVEYKGKQGYVDHHYLSTEKP